MAKTMENRSRRQIHPCPSDEAGEEPPGHRKQCRAAQVRRQAAHARDYSFSRSPEASSDEETKTNFTCYIVPTCLSLRSYLDMVIMTLHNFFSKILAQRRLYPQTILLILTIVLASKSASRNFIEVKVVDEILIDLATPHSDTNF